MSSESLYSEGVRPIEENSGRRTALARSMVSLSSGLTACTVASAGKAWYGHSPCRRISAWVQALS